MIGQDVTTQGLPTTTSSPTDLSISGNGFFVVATRPTGAGTQEFTRAGSFTPDANGNLVNSAGLYLMGYKLDSAGNVPTNTTDLSLVNVSSLSGTARPRPRSGACRPICSPAPRWMPTYTAGDMAAGTATPDFQRTINVYDSQGGSQPLTFSFIKTGANSWAYEASYAGAAANLSSANPISTGTVTFNSDGTLNNVNGAAPASGKFSLTIPWAASTGLVPQTMSVDLGAVNGTSGLTQFDAASTLKGSIANGSPFGAITGVQVAKDGTVTALFSNGLSQDVYKIPIATFTNPDGLGQVNGNAYIATKASGAASVNLASTGSAGGIQPNRWKARRSIWRPNSPT